MRHIDRLPKPAILVLKAAEWQEKYEERLAKNPQARPENTKYGHKDIRDALYTMSYGKCFYCETRLSGSLKEVDHHIEVAIDHGKAYEWDNLYLACNSCNDKLDHHAIPVTEALDPCRDSDEEIKRNITFEREQCISVDESRKGLNTIKKYHLNTELLDLKRSKWLNKLLIDASKIHSKMIAEGRKEVAEEERKIIRRYMSPEQPYSLMCEVFIKTNLRDLL